MLVPRGGCRRLRPTRPTPSWHRRQAIAPQGFGLLPVRSPLLRESSLFLGVLRCFSSPGALFGIAPKVPGRAPGGLPHSDIPGSPAASASPGHFAAWPRPSSAANAKASTMRPSCGYPACVPHRDASQPRQQTGSRQRDGPVQPRLTAASLPRSPRWVVVCLCVVLFSYFNDAFQCARASRHEPPHPTGHPGWSRTRVTMSRADRPSDAVGPSPSPAAAEPSGFRVARCKGAQRPESRRR